MRSSVNWPAAGGCVGFLVLEVCAFLAGVAPGQIYLRAGAGALLGALIGAGIQSIPEPPPSVPAKSWKPENQGTIIDTEVGDDGD